MQTAKPEIIYEDGEILIVAKPAGMVVNRAETTSGTTLQDWVEGKLQMEMSEIKVREDEEIFRQRSGVAHRLDKETSGVMAIGKNPFSLKELMRQFKNREVSKEYLALVHGKLEPKRGVINLPVGRLARNRQRFGVDIFGKPAITAYQVERVWPDYSLVRLYPRTGRTHQIRVHLSHLGHPLVGDEVYGGRKRAVKDRVWCPRHFLHAAVLEIKHPISGQRMKFEAPLPADLKGALDELVRF